MELLFSCVATVTMLVAFTTGFFAGRGRRERGSGADSRDSFSVFGKTVRTVPQSAPFEPAKPDKVKQLEYEAEQKAWADCLNYSIDVAYGGKQ